MELTVLWKWVINFAYTLYEMIWDSLSSEANKFLSAVAKHLTFSFNLLKMCIFMHRFQFRKKSQGAKSSEYGGCFNLMFFGQKRFHRKCCVRKNFCNVEFFLQMFHVASLSMFMVSTIVRTSRRLSLNIFSTKTLAHWKHLVSLNKTLQRLCWSFVKFD